MHTVPILFVFVSVSCFSYFVVAYPSCMTPNGEVARCVPMLSCQPIVKAVSTRNQTAVDFAKKSQCSSVPEVRVCCGSTGYPAAYQTSQPANSNGNLQGIPEKKNNLNLVGTTQGQMSKHSNPTEGNYKLIETNYNPIEINYNPIKTNFNPIQGNYNPSEENFSQYDLSLGLEQQDYQPVKVNYRPVSANKSPIKVNFRPLDESFISLEENFDSLDGNVGQVDTHYPLDSSYQLETNQHQLETSYYPEKSSYSTGTGNFNQVGINDNNIAGIQSHGNLNALGGQPTNFLVKFIRRSE